MNDMNHDVTQLKIHVEASQTTQLESGTLTPSALIPAHYGGGVGRWRIEERGRREDERKEGRKVR